MGQGWGSVSHTVPRLRGPQSRTVSREGGERRLCPPVLPDAGSPLVSAWLSSLAVLKEGPRSLRRPMPHRVTSSASALPMDTWAVGSNDLLAQMPS